MATKKELKKRSERRKKRKAKQKAELASLRETVSKREEEVRGEVQERRAEPQTDKKAAPKKPTLIVNTEFPKKFAFLDDSFRYKVLYGGRGSAKSWSIARKLLLRGLAKKELILCTRELQVSIKDSVHALLKYLIADMGLGKFYEVKNTEIICHRSGTRFIFKGLRHNADEIKSTEGITICWVEEAQKVSKASWEILIPTVRADGSEIWISFNPMLEADETYQRFVIKNPTDSKVVEVSYTDNPWFNDILRQEMMDLKRDDYDAYENVWLGKCRRSMQGAVYAEQIRAAEDSGRICKVPYDPSAPVDTFWDLGYGDNTSIWFAQFIAREYRVLKFYQNCGKDLAFYAKYLQETDYVFGRHYLPHDGANKSIQTGKSSEQILGKLLGGPKNIVVVPRVALKADGINASRMIFAQCVFDKEGTADGMNNLRHYTFEVDEETGLFSDEPVHDINSHAADAFQTMAMANKEHNKPVLKGLDKPRLREISNTPTGWMR